MEIKEFIVTEEKQNIRCDKFLSDKLEDFSRESLKKLFKEGEVFLNDEKVKPSRKLIAGERVKVNLPEPEVLDVIAENIPINIVYEDEDLSLIHI